jgi:hypothetical protein
MVIRYLAIAIACLSCAAPARAGKMGEATLTGSDGIVHHVPDAPLTVLVFFSPNCAYQTAHDERLRLLHDQYRPRGVAFFSVDSETSGSLARDEQEARARRYPFPILRDEGARLARAVGAQYATYSVILDRDGRVLYSGAIDGDRVTLRDATPWYLRDALEDLLAGRALRVTHSEAPGCALQTW